MENRSIYTIVRKELSESIYRLHPMLRLAFSLLFIGILIGFYSSYVDAAFLNSFIGASRIEMIEAQTSNIFSGPNLKEDLPGFMLFQVSSHNIFLAGIAFISGIFIGLISLYLLVYNALIMGVIIAQIWDFHGLAVFRSTVFLHGLIELFAFTICVAAGFNLAKGLIIKSDKLTRKDGLMLAFKDGMKILMLMIPVFLLAGFIESMISIRWPEIPALVNIVFLLLFGSLFYIFQRSKPKKL